MTAIDWKTLFVTFTGRIGRPAFWIGFVAVMIVSFSLQLAGTVGQVLGLATLWPMAAIHAKRLHDFGKSAWWLGVPVGVTACALFAGWANRVADGAGGLASKALMLAAFAVAVGFLLWVGLSRGDEGPNRYGAAVGGQQPGA